MSRRRLILLFAAITLVPAITVVGLGLRLLDQDTQLEARNLADRREQAADRAARALDLALDGALRTNPHPGALLVTLPDGPLLFRVLPFTLPSAPAAAFAEAERAEFLENNHAGAVSLYRTLAATPDPALRAGALLRLARALRKSGNPTAALEAYSSLERIETAAAGPYPAPLTAIWARCLIFEEARDVSRLRAESQRLRDVLDSGRYPLSRASYASLADDAAKWSGVSRPALQELLTQAVLDFAGAPHPPSGRALSILEETEITLAWQPSPRGLAVFAAPRAWIERHILPAAGVPVKLLAQSAPLAAGFSRRYTAETRLPWIIDVSLPASHAGANPRRPLLLLLFAAVVLFSLAGGYFVLRALQRELALSRLQSDFLAAVSHEFRTPITSLRQITEALEDDRVADEKRRRSYYLSLSRSTERLHRLVEDLLDFRRMESGSFSFRLIPTDASQLVRNVAEEFRGDSIARGFNVIDRAAEPAPILADPSAISRALWNLLENAAKYSGDARTIEISLACQDGQAAITVADRGIGIPPAEQRRLFDRFYRGEQARTLGIRGTGIGLTLVHQIVLAHNGRVSLRSEPGRGSAFTISIPLETSPCPAS